MRIKLFSALFIGAFVLGACNKENDNPEPIITDNKATEVKNLDASSNQKWVYFSFSEGKIVDVTDPKNELTWDIAFNRLNVQTNGGTSGRGQGGVFNSFKTDFSLVTEAPASGYTFDEEIEIQGMPGTPVIKSSVNKAITGTAASSNPTGWINYVPPTGQSMQPTVQITKNVYVVKTASGKFAKIQLTGYHNDKNTSGFITFQYQLSQDGKF